MVRHENGYLLRLVYHKIPSLVHFFLFFLIDFSDDSVSTIKLKLFAVDTSLFSVLHDSYISSNKLNNDQQKKSEWFINRKCHSMLI